jgi:hypothetical protein
MQRSFGGEFQELAINAACSPEGCRLCATISVKQTMQPGERKMAEENWLEGSNSGVSPAFGQMDGGQQPAVRHELRPLTTGEVLDRTFFLYRSNFWLYAGLASIAAGVNVLASLGKLTYLHFASIPATSPDTLKDVDAAKATLILAEPNFPTEGSKQVQAEITDFLSRGGYVLATGREGTLFLPGAKTEAPTRLYQRLCFSTPEGTGATGSGWKDFTGR